MSSINWLGFSLYPQDHQDISASAVNCYDLMTATSNPSEHHPLNLPSSFGVLEAFNRDTTQSQLDWNLKASTPACSQLEPKLENFLGNSSHSTSFYDDHQHTTSNGDYMFSNGALDQPNITRPQSTLSLSMTTTNGEGNNISNKQQIITVSSGISKQTTGAIESAVPKKSIDTFGQRTSIYRGVTRHRWTGRYEAHLWDNSCRREGQTRKGRQVYLGGYDKEDKAARSYDLAALKYWGSTTTTNFPISNYEKEIDEMKHMTRQEYVASLRRKSSGFSRGASIYRGVTRHHQHGRWQARIGRVAGNKDLYLGTFSTQEEAAEAYDIAAIKFRGLNAVTNFEINRYDVKAILESSSLPIGGAAKRLKEVEDLTAAAAQKIKSQTLMNIELQYYQHQYNQQQTRFKQEFQDHVHQQLQLGNTHNLMGLDNSINIYGEGGYNHYQLMPTPTATPASSFLGQNIGNHQVNDGLLLMENENMGCYNWISTVMPTRNAPPPFTVWNTDT